MIRSTQGNLLTADVEALVNTVNTVGVMGKGIALMFKEAFPDNYRAYKSACDRGEIKIGKMFVFERPALHGPRWIINFPTKEHWRGHSRLEWIESGLHDLTRVLEERGIKSVAIPPLGSGNGGLEWHAVRAVIVDRLSTLSQVDIVLYEPTREYLNVAKPAGVESLTPARALVAELIRRYWVLGIDCTLLEVQKLAWFLSKSIVKRGLRDPLHLSFKPERYGPYSDELRHLLNALDGSYLNCERRLADAKPFDVIRFEDAKRERVAAYLKSEAQEFLPALDATSRLIDGFESPFGMELLGTVDWLVEEQKLPADVDAVRKGLQSWPHGAERKQRLFDQRAIGLALERIAAAG